MPVRTPEGERHRVLGQHPLARAKRPRRRNGVGARDTECTAKTVGDDAMTQGAEHEAEKLRLPVVTRPLGRIAGREGNGDRAVDGIRVHVGWHGGCRRLAGDRHHVKAEEGPDRGAAHGRAVPPRAVRERHPGRLGPRDAVADRTQHAMRAAAIATSRFRGVSAGEGRSEPIGVDGVVGDQLTHHARGHRRVICPAPEAGGKLAARDPAAGQLIVAAEEALAEGVAQ